MVQDQDGTSVTTTDCGSRFWKNSRKEKEGDIDGKLTPFEKFRTVNRNRPGQRGAV